MPNEANPTGTGHEIAISKWNNQHHLVVLKGDLAVTVIGIPALKYYDLKHSGVFEYVKPAKLKGE